MKTLHKYDEAEDAWKWGQCFGMVEGALIFAITFVILSVI